MISVGISEFRANMNHVLTRVNNGEIAIITSRGVEMAKLVPPDYAQTAARKELEALRQTAVVGDVLSPLDEPWEASV